MSRRGWFALLVGALLVTAGVFLVRSFLAESGIAEWIAVHHGRRARTPGGDGRAAPAAPASDGEWDPRLPPLLTEPAPLEGARVDEVEHLEVLVRVVDGAGGVVAGIPVALGVLDSKFQSPRATARSGAEGLARLTGYADALRAEQAGADWCVYFPFPEAEAHLAPVDPWHPPDEPIELIAPELGRLVVKVEDASGAPLHAAGELTLFGWPDREMKGKSTRSAPISLPLTAPGELAVDPIATGLRVRVDAWLAEYASASAEGDGPRRAGETATLTLVLPRHGPIVTGQLIGDDGKPVATTSLLGIVHDDPQLRMATGDVKLASDAQGRFRFDASKYELDDPERPRWLDLLGVGGGGATGKGVGVTGRARAALPIPFGAGECDVGRLPYERAPVVVAGHVVDESGQPAPLAQIRVCRFALVGADGLRAPSGAGDVVFGSSDGLGAFELRGFIVADEQTVFAIDGRKRESAPTAFVPGARDVTLVVRGCGVLEGSLVMDPAIDSIHVGLFLRRADALGGGRGPFQMLQAPARDATFRWNRVVAGRVDVAVGLGRYSREPEIVLVVPDVEVLADVVNRDPRIAGIDLRARIPKARVELFGPDGSPLDDGAVALLSAAEPHAPILTVLVDHGVAELPTLRTRFDVEVRAAGLRIERRFDLTSPARIDLRAGIPVALVLDPPLAVDPAGPISLRLTLTPDDAPRASGGGQHRVDVAADGTAHVVVSDACRFRVDLEASRASTRAFDASQGDAQIIAMKKRWFELQERLDAAFGAPTIDVHDGATEQRLLVPLPLAAREALEQMARDFGDR